MSEHIETGFEELFAQLQTAKVPKVVSAALVPASNVAGKQQSQQQPGPNAANTAAQLPANAPATPVTPRRAVSVASLPAVPPKRQWLCGTDLMRGAVSMLVAPGARAKTTWLLTCALSCASGRDLLDARVYGGPHRVLYLSAEDSTNEIALRLRAAMQHHGLNDSQVPGLHVIGADKWGLPLLRSAGGTPLLNEEGWNALHTELDQIEPAILILDPLINLMGGVNANDNSAAALLMGQFVSLATRRHIALVVAHHAAKGRDPTSAESAMGAASFINLTRIALGIEPLDEKDAEKLGLPSWEAKFVFRVLGTKQNFSPPQDTDRWYRLQSFEVQNQQPPIYPTGDRVAVVEVFHPHSSRPAFPSQLIRDALTAVDSAAPPLSPSKNSRERYAAPIIADAIASHRGGRASEVEGKSVLDHLVRTGLVSVAPVKLSRSGGRADERKGLVLTATGKAVLHEVADSVSPSPPQSPQSPAEPTAGNAGNADGDALGGPPHRKGGVGGVRGTPTRPANEVKGGTR